jgi:hypothetical protein
MGAQDRQADAIKRRFSGGELLKDFHAQTGFLHHPPDAPHLSFNAIESGHQKLLLRGFQHAMCPVSIKKLSRKLLRPPHSRVTAQ